MYEQLRPRPQLQKYEQEPSTYAIGNTRQRESAMGEYLSLRDYLLRGIGSGKFRFLWNSKDGRVGLKDEIFSSKNTQTEMLKRIAFLDNNGYTPESLAHYVWEQRGAEIPETWANDVQDIRDEINDILLSHDTPTSMIDAAEALRSQPETLEEYIEQTVSPEEIAEYEANEASQNKMAKYLPEEKAKEISAEELDYYKPERVELSDVSELTDEDFSGAYRDVVLPSLPDNVGEMIGANGRKILIKKNIFDKNNLNHPELGNTDEQLNILRSALYHPDLLIYDKPASKPNYWVVVKMGDKYANALLDVDSSKENVEVVNWYWLNDKTLEGKKKRAIREGGQVLITVKTGQPSEISALPDNSIGSKDSKEFAEKQEKTPKFTGDVVSFAKDVVKNHEIAQEADKVDTNPTEGQKQAGNYQKGHINVQGFDITIENPKGSVRSGVDADGKAWETTMQNHYGYFKLTEGKDGDHIDVFVGYNPTSEKIFVVDQVDPQTKEFDESKVMLGFTSAEDAKAAYMSNYEADWQGFGNITEVSVEDFKKWLYDGAKQRKEFADYKENKDTRGKRQDGESKEQGAKSKDNSELGVSSSEDQIVSDIKSIDGEIELTKYIKSLNPENITEKIADAIYTQDLRVNSDMGVSSYYKFNPETMKYDEVDGFFVEESDFDNVVDLIKWYYFKIEPNKRTKSIIDVAKKAVEEDKAKKQEIETKPENTPLFRVVSDTGFYSTVEDALERIKQEKGTKEQFKAMLLKNGAKQAEMGWMGFDELPDKLTKTDIQEWIDKNRIEVEEVEKAKEQFIKPEGWYVEELFEPLYDDGYRMGDIDDADEFVKTNLLDNIEPEEILSKWVDFVNYKEKNTEESTEYSNYTLPGGENYKELLLTLPKIKNAEKYKQFHISEYYADAPTFAHVRFNERVVNGERVLFIEEVQSDWAQDIRNKKDSSIPDMPFKSTTQWINLAMRRMMRYAAENGFDRIAWTTGEQQVDRYDLSKQVDRIIIDENGGVYDIIVYPKGKQTSETLKDGIAENELADYVGKEIAEKAISDKGGDFTGDDLKVGGHGMKWFYDQILPKAVQKLGKPFGARVENIELPKIGTQQSIPVTDAMIKSVSEGVPLFRIIGEKGASRLENAERVMADLRVAREMETDFNDRPKRLEKLRNSKDVEISGKEHEGKYELNRDSAKQWLKDNLRGSYEIADTGEQVEISRKGVNKVTSHSMGSEAHLKSLIAIPELLHNSIFITQEQAEKENAQYESYRYYVTGLKIGEEYYTAKLTVGVDRYGNKFYDHALTELEKTKLIDYVNQSVPGFISTVGVPNPSVTVSKDTKLLSILQTDEKENAKKIRLATGWERGTDGKWRYETPDEKVDARQLYKGKLNTLGKIMPDSELLRTYPELSDVKVLFDKLQVQDARFVTEHNSDTGSTQYSIVLNERFLDDINRVGIKSIEREIEQAQKTLKEGYSDKQKETAQLFGVELQTPEQLQQSIAEKQATLEQAYNDFGDAIHSTLIHEVQHAIQKIEGFAGGGSIQQFSTQPKGTKLDRAIYDFHSYVKDLEGDLYENIGKVLFDDRFDNFRYVLRAEGEKVLEGINDDTVIDALSRSYKNKDKEVFMRNYNYSVDKINTELKNPSAYTQYKNLAGEVEARNVQARMNYTPEQRREMLLQETEDVAREQQIVLREALGEQESKEQGTRSKDIDEVSLKAIETVFEKAGIPVEYVTDEEAQKKYAEVRARESDAQMRKAKKTSLDTVVGEQSSPLKATVVSSDAGAKILQNIDKTIDKFENDRKTIRGFIGELGQALELKNTGASQYGTFETPKGEVFTLRLSNHNATVSNFDNNNENNGVSIVISRKPNTGIVNDGNAHVVEFFYPDKAINKSESRALAEIAKSVKQLLYSGEYKDTTGLAEVEEVNEAQFRLDRADNPIGDGNWHVEHDIINLDKYPQVVYKVNYSDTTESVYVEYTNKENNKSVTVRFSNHENNAVKFGDQLNGNWVRDDEILYRLGLKNRIFIPETKKDIGAYQVKRAEAKSYEEADKTIQELYDLPVGTDLSAYKGKRVKSNRADKISNWIIGGDVVKESQVYTSNILGQHVPVGKYEYTDIDEGSGQVSESGNSLEFRVSSDELAAIKERAIADGTFMKAPNGKATNLTEKQWLQVRTKAFKEWFGDWENDPQNASKVVDENGDPLVVYHGTTNLLKILVPQLIKKREDGSKYIDGGKMREIADEFIKNNKLFPFTIFEQKDKVHEGTPTEFPNFWFSKSKKVADTYANEGKTTGDFVDFMNDIRYDKHGNLVNDIGRYDILRELNKSLSLQGVSNEKLKEIKNRADDLGWFLPDFPHTLGGVYKIIATKENLHDLRNALYDGYEYITFGGKTISQENREKATGEVFGFVGSFFINVRSDKNVDYENKIWKDKVKDKTLAEIVTDAYNDGADGITIKNIIDAGNMGAETPTDEYVVFSPNQIKSATDNVGTFDGSNPDIRLFTRPGRVDKDAAGAPIVYGWTENGKVYLVKERLNPETPAHEYDHLWNLALMKNNPDLWKHGVELLKQTPMWEQIKNDPNYSHLKTDDQIADEVKAHLNGKRGAETFAKMQQEAKDTGDITVFAKAVRLIDDIKKWLKDTWYWLMDTMTNWSRADIERVTLDDFLNMTLSDMIKGTPLSPKGEVSSKLDSAPDGAIAASLDSGVDVVSSFEFRVPSDELAAIKERAIADGTFMKAPNGKATNLTEKQWLQVRTKAFKEWFGDWENDPQNASKVVDENGDPLVVYHGTNERFAVFKSTKFSTAGYFAKNRDFAAEFSKVRNTDPSVMDLFLSISNPLDLSKYDGHKEYNSKEIVEILPFLKNTKLPWRVDRIQGWLGVDEIINEVKKAGYNGVYYNEANFDYSTMDKDGNYGKLADIPSLIAFEPNQIKSATDNFGTFDEGNDDIRFRVENKKARQRADELMDNADDLRKVIPDYNGFLNKVFQQGFTKEQRKSVAEAKGDWYKAIERELATIEDAEKLEYIAHLLDADLTIGQVKYLFRRNLDPNNGSAKWQAREAIRVEDLKGDVVIVGHKPINDGKLESYEKIVKSKGFRHVFEHYNSDLPLREFQKLLLGKDYYEVENFRENAYQALKLSKGRGRHAMDVFAENIYKPLIIHLSKINDKLNEKKLETIKSDLKGNKSHYMRATIYAMAKSGLSRMEIMARRDADAYKKELLNKPEINGLKGDAYNEAVSEIEKAAEKQYKAFLKRDVSGLTALAELVGRKEENFKDVAESIVKEVEGVLGKEEVDKFWDEVFEATQWANERSFESGKMSREEYERRKDRDAYYLPHRGYDITTAADIYDYKDRESGNFDSLFLRAKGRTTLAEDPFAHIASMAASAVLEAERNKAKQALLRLIETHPNDIVSVRDAWVQNVGTKNNPEWVETYPELSSKDTPEAIKKKVDDFERRMKALSIVGMARRKRNSLNLGEAVSKTSPAISRRLVFSFLIVSKSQFKKVVCSSNRSFLV